MFCTSVSLSVFLPEQPHQTEQDGSRHHQQTDNHCRRNREVNAGLNDGRVGDACKLQRRDVSTFLKVSFMRSLGMTAIGSVGLTNVLSRVNDTCTPLGR